MRKIKLLGLVLLLQFSFGAVAQEDEETKAMYYKYWVKLKDKETSKYSIEKPLEYLTQRAIDRREKQNIAVTEQDFPVNEAYAKKIQEDFNATVISRSRWFNALIVEVYEEKTMENIKKLDFVTEYTLLGEWEDKEDEEEEEEDFEKDSAYYANLEKAIDSYEEPYRKSYIEMPDVYKLKTGIYGDAQKQIKILNGIKLHDMGYDGSGMVIAILDAGFYKVNTMPQFDSLRKNGQILGTKDLVAYDGDVYKDDNHGMNVLSCIGANMPGEIVGTAPKASFWLIRTEDDGSEFPVEEANWVIGAEYADSVGADVINSSLGYTTFNGDRFPRKPKALDGKTSIATLGADIAASKGIIICTSAGNSGTNKEWKFIGSPADAFNVLSVGGITKSKNRSSFSSYGPTADGRVKPTVSAVATSSVVAKGKTSGTADGTSFASPILCGMVACLWQANPTKTYKEIMDAIIQSSSHVNNPDDSYGNGVPDFYVANILLGNKGNFNFNQDQLISPVTSDFTDWIDIRFFSSVDQEIEVLIQYEAEEGGKRKKVYKSSQEVKKGEFLVLTPQKKLKAKKTEGKYILTIVNAQGIVFTRTLEK